MHYVVLWRMTDRSKMHDWKAWGANCLAGSNPTPSAIVMEALMGIPDFKALKEKQLDLYEDAGRDKSLLPLSWRMERALSWLERANWAKQEGIEDRDTCFILLWIGFNAAYGRDPEAGNGPTERKKFQNYFKILVKHDSKNCIYHAVCQRFPQEILRLLGNKYVLSEFWDCRHEKSSDESKWREKVQDDWSYFQHNMNKRQCTPKILRIVFHRLYVLRNQLMHGGATWNSSYSRNQVRDGEKIMGGMLPIFIELMLDNRHENWGSPWYPRINDPRYPQTHSTSDK